MGLNPEAMFALLESEEGPVGQFVKQKAELVRDLARVNVEDILHRMPSGPLSTVTDNIEYEQNGTEAVIGIRHGGDIEDYLATKELRELVWLFPAGAEAFVPND